MPPELASPAEDDLLMPQVPSSQYCCQDKMEKVEAEVCMLCGGKGTACCVLRFEVTLVFGPPAPSSACPTHLRGEVQQAQGAAITESHRPQVIKICHWQRWPEESPQAWQAKEDSSGNRKKEAVLKFSITWNTNSRNYVEAQAVVETLLKHETPESLLQYKGIKAAVESLLPYTALPEAGPDTAGLHVP
ncbi:Transducin beta 3 [Podarcis lilfordi]|uniref:Transducin beta 3 n=1 Tax=Podarcis lilfordi TaxID=74358 RepID=A0AA35LC26_9SAUR|nr:Transducin beta 3 [Podarcis lilfordi]